MATLGYSDLETRVANALRIPTSNTTEMTKLRGLANIVYRDIRLKYPDWPSLRKRQVINTSDDISAGTVSVTNGSTSFTYSSAPSVSTAGRVLLVTGETTDSGVVMRISAHTASSTSGTFDAAYSGTTNATASYRVYHDTYDMATDVGEVRFVKRDGYPWPVRIIPPEEMLQVKQYSTETGKPHLAAVYDYDTSGDPTTQKQLVIHPYPDATYRMEVHYQQTLNTELSGSTRPLIPDDLFQLLYYGTLARGYPIFLNDLERGAFFQALFNDLLALAVATNRRHEAHPGIRPDDTYRGHFRSRRRYTPATADLGSYFDRWPIAP